MQKNSTLTPYPRSPVGLLVMVLLALVIIFFVYKHFDNKIKMLRQQSHGTVTIAAKGIAVKTNTS